MYSLLICQAKIVYCLTQAKTQLGVVHILHKHVVYLHRGNGDGGQKYQIMYTALSQRSKQSSNLCAIISNFLKTYKHSTIFLLDSNDKQKNYIRI